MKKKIPDLKGFMWVSIIQTVLLLVLFFAYYHIIPLSPHQWLTPTSEQWFDASTLNNPWLLSWVILFGVFYTLSDNGEQRGQLTIISILYGIAAGVLLHFAPDNPYGISIALISDFALLCFLQQYQQQGKSQLNYTRLFNAVWNNMAAILLTLVFVALAIGVLALWAALFYSIGIHFFSRLFQSLLFSCLVGPALFAIGLFTVLKLQTICDNARHILLSFCRLLLPLLALISVLYIIASIIDWSSTANSANNIGVLHSLLPVLAFLGIVFINATYQTGEERVHLFFKLSALILTCCMSLLLIRDLYNRCFTLHSIGIDNLAVHVISLSAVAGLLLLLLYHLCYFFSHKQQWQIGNISLAWFTIIISIALAFLPKPAQQAQHAYGIAPPPTKHTLADAKFKWVTPQQLLKTKPVVLGYNQNGAIYTCRATIEDALHNGELQNGRCTLIANQQAYDVDEFEILAGGSNTAWRQYPASNDNNHFAIHVSDNAKQNSPLKICRAIYQNNIHIGSFDGVKCWVTDGLDVTAVRPYQILYATVSPHTPGS
ncbi:MAG: DUF3421 domain-containing protein [Coxiellaceae bacterium]|nr:DUF3421 domain-containing protein [Coxiellaceae bacterium]